jgi:hypothetical protein
MTTTSYNFGQRAILEIETTGSAIEAAAGVGVIVLAIIGLSQSNSAFMASIAAIVLGAALLAQGGALAAEYSKLLSMITGGAIGTVELGGGMTVEMLAGGGITVLGILGLLGFAPDVLISSAVIVAGASLVLASSGLQRLNTLKVQAAGLSDLAAKVAEGAVAGAITTQVLASGAAVVLGILALTMTGHAGTLMLVGLLVLGASVAVSGAALTGRLLRLFNAKA